MFCMQVYLPAEMKRRKMTTKSDIIWLIKWNTHDLLSMTFWRTYLSHDHTIFWHSCSQQCLARWALMFAVLPACRLSSKLLRSYHVCRWWTAVKTLSSCCCRLRRATMASPFESNSIACNITFHISFSISEFVSFSVAFNCMYPFLLGDFSCDRAHVNYTMFIGE